jgi:hypothetical protein
MIMHRRREPKERMVKACVADMDESPEEQQKRPRHHGPGHGCAGLPCTAGTSQLGVDITENAHGEWQGGGANPRQNFRDVYGWLSRPYADTPDRYLESPPQTSLFGA